MAHTPRADVVLPSKQSFYTTCQQDTWWRASFCKMMCPVFNNYSIAFFRLCTSRTFIKNVVQVCLLQLLHHITINHVWDFLFLLPAAIDFTSPISCSYLVQNKQHMALGTGQCQVFGHPPECWYTVVCPWPTECVSCQFTDGTSNIFITQRVSTLHQTLQRQNKLLQCRSLQGIQNNIIRSKISSGVLNLLRDITYGTEIQWKERVTQLDCKCLIRLHKCHLYFLGLTYTYLHYM